MREAPIVIIGAGLAGLFCALRCAPRPVILVADCIGGGASRYAQGGIAACTSYDDSLVAHCTDTLLAGDGLCDAKATEQLLSLAPACMNFLSACGIVFDTHTDGLPFLHLEAAHSNARIHTANGGAIGKMLMQKLRERVMGAEHITCMEKASPCALFLDSHGAIAGISISCHGKDVFLRTNCLVLAMGGIGGLFLHSTNPTGLCGTALALGARAGALLRNMEFIQFHPSALDLPHTKPAPLITEALRGAGAWLVDASGHRFMRDYHPQAELAPRHVVALHTAAAAQKGAVYLDATRLDTEFLRTHFAGIDALCRRFGFDMTQQKLPVKPVQHYHMGGIATDCQGTTSVPGLWAVGENACTGLHGANRLASNSLSEAAAMAELLSRHFVNTDAAPLKPGRFLKITANLQKLDGLKPLMETCLGVERHAEGLKRLLAFCTAHKHEHDDALVAACIADAALKRTESRGAHRRKDFPDAWKHSFSSTSRLERDFCISTSFSPIKAPLRKHQGTLC